MSIVNFKEILIILPLFILMQSLQPQYFFKNMFTQKKVFENGFRAIMLIIMFVD